MRYTGVRSVSRVTPRRRCPCGGDASRLRPARRASRRLHSERTEAMKMHVAGKLGGVVDTPDLAGIIADVLGFTRNTSHSAAIQSFAVSENLEQIPAQTVRGLQGSRTPTSLLR